MELQKYDLEPQQQLAVSLYLKSMNKTQAARDAGYSSPSVFNNITVKAAIADQLSIRAERLRVGGDWVLGELKRVYDRCMETEPALDKNGTPTGEYRFDANNAIKALALIGKHVDVRAFDDRISPSTFGEEMVDRLNSARLRVASQPLESLPPADELIEALDEPEEDTPPVSFMGDESQSEPIQDSDAATVIRDTKDLITEEEKFDLLKKRWVTGNPLGY